MPALAGRTIKDNLSESEQRETGRCGQEQGRPGDKPFAVLLACELHKTISFVWVEGLHALRAGRVQPVQGETFAVVQKIAWKMQRSFGDLSEFI
jgi:hypothetical protein